MSRIPLACCTLTRTASRHLFSQTKRSISSDLFYATQASVSSSTDSDKLPAGSPKKGIEPTKTFTPKIEELVLSISQLTLIEASELVEALKSRLKITEVAMPINSAPLNGAQSTASGDGETKQKKEEPQKPKEKTAFTLTLTQIDAAQKAKVIKEIKTIMPNMNLVEAKKFVESLPKQLKENATKEEVEKLKKALESVGATVTVE